MFDASPRRQIMFWGIALWFLLVGDELAAVADGVYSGATSQGESISITVSGGSITGYSMGWSCGGSTGT